MTSKVEHDFLFPIFRCKNYLTDLGYTIKLKNKLDNSLLNCDILCVLSTCIRHHGKDNVYMDELRKFSELAKLTYFLDISDSGGLFYEIGFEIGQVYYKKQIYHDRSYYTNSNTCEPRMHFDYVIKNNFIKKDSHNIPDNYSHISKNIIDDIRISWNVGLGDYRTFSFPSKTLLRGVIRMQTKICRKPMIFPMFQNRYDFNEYSDRNVDLLSCFGSYDLTSKPISFHRKASADMAASLNGDYKVASGFFPVDEYYTLLRKAKMALSPFGWGEMTWKDFEVFINGIALLKPNMSHLETWPNYYIENETYLPYSWDASELGELIERVLSDEGFLEEVARNGQERFRSFNVHNDPSPFIERFQTVFA